MKRLERERVEKREKEFEVYNDEEAQRGQHIVFKRSTYTNAVKLLPLSELKACLKLTF
jgi:hypothetical protein